MKNLIKIHVIYLLLLLFISPAMIAQDSVGITSVKNRYFKFQARIKGGAGTNFKSYPYKLATHDIHYLNNETFDVDVKSRNGADDKQDFLKSKWGGYGGANFDFYFHKNIGFGVDIDYFNNKFKFVQSPVLTDFINELKNNSPSFSAKLIESNRKNQQLVFFGIGPSAKLYTNDKVDVDLNVRVGLSHLRMGALAVGIDTLPRTVGANNKNRNSILDFDYNKAINAAGLKVGLYVNYWFHKNVGITAGIDYVHSFVSNSKINGDADYKLKYLRPEDFMAKDDEDLTFAAAQYFDQKTNLDDYPTRKLNINHLAVSAGLVFKVEKTKTIEKKEKEYIKDIIVTVKDKFTGMPVDKVDVTLTDESGKVLGTLQTAKDGKVVFPKIKQGVYGIKGDREGIKTTTTSVSKEDFAQRGNVYKEIFYEDPGFILEGVTIECGNKNKIMQGVEVELTNKKTGKVEKATSDNNGKFTFNLNANTEYSVVGTKDGYYSNIEEINTKDLDRNRTLYVKLKLCVEQLEVGKTFVLRNIYYDFDKCNIRNDASKELDHLVEIMTQYKNMTIELSSHTDQRGTDEYNRKLSQCRAESAVDYLVKRGIDKSRMIAVGYGESRLLEDCSKVPGCPTDSKGDCDCHQNNRRTEVKILKM